MTRLRAAHRVAAALLLMSPACVGALDLDGYQDAIAQLCKCDATVPQFGGNCVEVLTNRLAGVSEETRSGWLEYFGDQCAGKCDNAFACYQQQATCSEISCSEDMECCGYDEGFFCDIPTGTTGECKPGM